MLVPPHVCLRALRCPNMVKYALGRRNVQKLTAGKDVGAQGERGSGSA
jgi:hypothetical protein